MEWELGSNACMGGRGSPLLQVDLASCDEKASIPADCISQVGGWLLRHAQVAGPARQRRARSGLRQLLATYACI